MTIFLLDHTIGRIHRKHSHNIQIETIFFSFCLDICSLHAISIHFYYDQIVVNYKTSMDIQLILRKENIFIPLISFVKETIVVFFFLGKVKLL